MGEGGRRGTGRTREGEEKQLQSALWSANPSNFMCLNWLSSEIEEASFCTALE